jgi:hypothetical protein
LRSNISVERSSSAVLIAQDLIDKVRAWGAADWQNVYGLWRGATSTYYLNASGTVFFSVFGEEGMLDNDVTNGLIGEWKFDEATSTTSTSAYDSSGNNNTGTLVNSPTRQSGSVCKIANCLNFGGTNYVLVNASGSLAAAFSVAAWTQPSNTDDTLAIFGSRSPSDFSFDAKFNGDGTIHGDIGNGSSWLSTSADADLPYSAGVWYHIVYAVTGSGYTIYVNGNQVGIGTYSGTPLLYNTNHILRIGDSGYGEYFVGNIDDVRVYNHALSADEVKRLYTSNIYRRSFYVENVCRAISGSSTITGIYPCSGGSTDDPSTERVTVNVAWTLPNGNAQTTSLVDFLTRAKNAIFDQTDWSGGGGQEGPITKPNSLYYSGSNVDVTSTPGSFKIQNLYPQ